MKPSFGTASLTLALASLLALGGCNTIRGIGEDTEKAGEAIQDTADEASEDLKDDGTATGADGDASTEPTS
ncbi:entericidin A/B family lipoprotein [Arenimonas sp.]|uniref:entericidin A/B family lipoprotein n=1 Tax=Arenimonas sp. TaxID=1872635 RepID=UPI0025F178C0|nr:entericidin A/B family lipoprotein [Arenimonas sp.]